MGWRLKWAMLALLSITLSAAAPPPPDPLDQPMSFHAEEDGFVNRMVNDMYDGGERKIFAVGTITDGTAERFRAFVGGRGITNARVVLDSPGGSLIEGMKLGEAIRQLSFDTAVGTDHDQLEPSTAICASACAYTFAGGVNRFLTKYSGRLGLHQFYSQNRAPTDAGMTQQVSGVLVAYLQEMGVDANAFSIATLSKPEGIYWLSLPDAETLHFSNNGVASTTAELKIVNMLPYLKLEQVQFNFTARVIFVCRDKQLSVMAGVVTNPTTSQDHVAGLNRAYLELDDKESLVLRGLSAAKADQSTIWIQRALSPAFARTLLTTRRLGMWTENNPTIRWGGYIDLSTVHKPMQSYFAQCYG